MEIRGIRSVNGVPGVRHVSPDDDDEIEQEECAGCGEEFPSHQLTDAGLCEDCDMQMAWTWMYAEIEQQRRAGLREG